MVFKYYITENSLKFSLKVRF